MRYRTLLAAMTILIALPLGVAMAQPEKYRDLKPGQFPACPAAVEASFPNCAVSIVALKTGSYETCYCAHNVRAVPGMVIPPENQVIDARSLIDLAKITDKTKPIDPCKWIVIDGVRRYVCW